MLACRKCDGDSVGGSVPLESGLNCEVSPGPKSAVLAEMTSSKGQGRMEN